MKIIIQMTGFLKYALYCLQQSKNSDYLVGMTVLLLARLELTAKFKRCDILILIYSMYQETHETLYIF